MACWSNRTAMACWSNPTTRHKTCWAIPAPFGASVEEALLASNSLSQTSGDRCSRATACLEPLARRCSRAMACPGLWETIAREQQLVLNLWQGIVCVQRFPGSQDKALLVNIDYITSHYKAFSDHFGCFHGAPKGCFAIFLGLFAYFFIHHADFPKLFCNLASAIGKPTTHN